MNLLKINYYINAGTKDRDWYLLTENLFVTLFGRDQLPLVCDLFAATSINSSLKSNIRLFRRAHHEHVNNLPHTHYLPNIKQQLDQVRAGTGLTGKKIKAFSAAMQGDPNAVVVDIWLLRAFDMDRQSIRRTGPHKGRERSSGCTTQQFRAIEFYVRDKAALMGIEPRQLSAMIWSGTRSTLGTEKETRYHDILKHQLYNMFDYV